MPELRIEDRSTGGHDLRAVTVGDLPHQLTLRELLEIRVHSEVSNHNAEPGSVFRGLVQPADATAYSDGFHLPGPRTLDADRLVAAALQAFAAGMVTAEADGEPVADLDATLRPGETGRLVLLLHRPIVARTEDG